MYTFYCLWVKLDFRFVFSVPPFSPLTVLERRIYLERSMVVSDWRIMLWEEWTDGNLSKRQQNVEFLVLSPRHWRTNILFYPQLKILMFVGRLSLCDCLKTLNQLLWFIVGFRIVVVGLVSSFAGPVWYTSLDQFDSIPNWTDISQVNS